MCFESDYEHFSRGRYLDKGREGYDDRYAPTPTPHLEDLRDQPRDRYGQRGGLPQPEPYDRDRRGPPPDRFDRDKRGPPEVFDRDKRGPSEYKRGPPPADGYDRDRYARDRDRYGGREQRYEARDPRYEGNLGAGQSVFININIYQEWESSFHDVYFSFKINELF